MNIWYIPRRRRVLKGSFKVIGGLRRVMWARVYSRLELRVSDTCWCLERQSACLSLTLSRASSDIPGPMDGVCMDSRPSLRFSSASPFCLFDIFYFFFMPKIKRDKPVSLTTTEKKGVASKDKLIAKVHAGLSAFPHVYVVKGKFLSFLQQSRICATSTRPNSDQTLAKTESFSMEETELFLLPWEVVQTLHTCPDLTFSLQNSPDRYHFLSC